MYPRLSDLFRDLLGFELPFPIYSFGAMLAVSIFAAATLARRELDRMYAAELVPSVPVETKDAKGKVRTEPGSPGTIMWTLMLLAAVFGVAGSKLFHIFEYWGQFVRDPLAMVFSPAGLTFYGGLICASIATVVYLRRKGLPVGRVADAIAPGLMLGYGLGRIGCYLAGDGDWGICSDPADKPAGLPLWLWTESFPRNILEQDLAAACAGGGVYPTMLYEFAACALFAGILWAIRKHPYRAGWLFCVYLVLNGIERFSVEMIRVNPDNLGSFSQAQLIAMALIVAGIVGIALLTRKAGGPGARNAGYVAPAAPEPENPEGTPEPTAG